jgi:hypothetical protein
MLEMKYPPITYELMEEKTQISMNTGKCQKAFMKYVGRNGVLTRLIGIEGHSEFFWSYLALKLLDAEDYKKWNEINHSDPQLDTILCANSFFDLYGDYQKKTKVDKIVEQALQ